MSKSFFFSLLCCVLVAQLAHADSLPTNSCDTLVTTNGQTLLVQWAREDSTNVYFFDCGGTNWKEQSLPKAQIRSLKRMAPEGAQSAQVREIQIANKMVRKAVLLASLAAMTFLTGFMIWWPLIFAGFITAIAGWIIGRRGMRFTRNKAHLKEQHRLLWYAALPGRVLIWLLVLYLLSVVISLFLLLVFAL